MPRPDESYSAKRIFGTRVEQYLEHFHRERNHQGLGNELIDPEVSVAGDEIACRERLGRAAQVLLARRLSQSGGGGKAERGGGGRSRARDGALGRKVGRDQGARLGPQDAKRSGVTDSA